MSPLTLEDIQKTLDEVRAAEEAILSKLGNKVCIMHPANVAELFPQGIPHYLKSRIHASNLVAPGKVMTVEMNAPWLPSPYTKENV